MTVSPIAPPGSLPKPPDNADPKELQAWISDYCIWAKDNLINGLQATVFTSAQVAQMTQKSQFGKLFIESDTGVMKYATVIGGTFYVKTITAT